jgi:ATP-dependent RNA helicase DDX51/DBP6
MFSVQRFDPNETYKPKAVAKTKVKAPSTNDEETKSSKRQKKTAQDDDKRMDEDSSSVPSSESDSSSVVSSEDDEPNEPQTTLKVIAPSQPAAKDSKRGQKSHQGFEDEAIDDFDADFDIIETEAKADASSNLTDVAAARALRLSKLPIDEVASDRHFNLPPFLLKNLRADSYTNFFPIQCMVIPDVIESEQNAHIRGARDICCHAPTGSGKTLAFVLPLLTSLYNESISGTGARGRRRLRALVVLPVRDLAKQVYDVFVRYAKGSHIKVGLAIGGKKKADLLNERRSMVVDSYNDSWAEFRGEDGSTIRRRPSGPVESAAARTRFSFDPYSLNAALEAHDGTTRGDSCFQVFPENSGQSAIDILVTTPGRLVDHLDSTPGFTLQHLRFLVIDEADRLVNQPYKYQNWVGRVLEASNVANQFASGTSKYSSLSEYVKSPLQLAPDGITYIIDPVTHRVGSGVFGRAVPLRKMLFSATLTQDPQKLAVLGLNNPKHFDANRLIRLNHNDEEKEEATTLKAGSYSLPAGLTEKLVECTAEQKPLVLLALLLEHAKISDDTKKPSLIIVFTSSVDSTHRLARLLQLLWEGGGYGKSNEIAEFSSAVSAKQRAATLRRCRNAGKSDKVSVIVCSDGMARGMDLPSVTAVINYDVPAYAKTHVHRCGRTARAGKQGVAINVLKGGQIAKFRRMRKLIHGGSVETTGIKKDLVKSVVPMYKKCIIALKRIMEDEQNEELGPSDSLNVSLYL